MLVDWRPSLTPAHREAIRARNAIAATIQRKLSRRGSLPVPNTYLLDDDGGATLVVRARQRQVCALFDTEQGILRGVRETPVNGLHNFWVEKFP